MRAISSLQRNIWLGGDFEGVNAPCARVVVQVPKVSPAVTHVSTWRHTFEPPMLPNLSGWPRELRNLKSLAIDRGVDTDVASATMEFYNTMPNPNGTESPGAYTPGRGRGTLSNRWPTFAKNEYQDLLVPDRVLRTYQGYGSDMTVDADEDSHLVQTGEWWIDTVEFTHDGLITVKCRDRAGPGLVDQICFPPVIPANQYPLRFEAYHTEVVHTLPTTAWSTVRATYDMSSNFPYMSAGSGEYGHYGRDAFDSRSDSYWLSIGNVNPRRPFACEWVQGTVPNTEVSAVTIRPWKGNYTVYVSIFANGYWHGSNTVPYDNVLEPDNGSVIPYVLETTVGYEQTLRMVLDQTYNHVTKVRVSLTNLYDSNLGPYQYRGGIRSFVVERKVVTQHQHNVTRGNYADYCDIIKKLLSWGGFFWPGDAKQRAVSGVAIPVPWAPLKCDPIVDGRVWADIEMSGTAGIASLEVPVWDKKPLMDCLSYIRDILGYIFFVDEEGAAVFRSPNIWQIGNFLQTRSAVKGTYTSYMPELDERTVLRGLKASLSKRNSRSKVFVGNNDGQLGALAASREPYPVGWNRIALWTDQNFKTQAECQVMADLITLRQMFTFREDNLTISANPALQPDDQVRIFERVTGENYIHYIKSISSKWDNETREWTMDLTTHWLGEQTYQRWAFDPADGHWPQTLQYLIAVGKVKG